MTGVNDDLRDRSVVYCQSKVDVTFDASDRASSGYVGSSPFSTSGDVEALSGDQKATPAV
jgi:hypothetical protein